MDIIRGRATITLGDRLRAQWTRRFKYTAAAFVIFIVGMTVFGFHVPLVGWLDVAVYAAALVVTTLLMVLIWLMLIVIAMAIVHARTSAAQRDISYAFDDAGFTLRDATGASFSCPWSIVIRIRETSRAFRIENKPMGSRYIPKRAFGADEIVALRALLKAKLGKAAKV